LRRTIHGGATRFDLERFDVARFDRVNSIDPIRDELRRKWAALLRGDTTPRSVALWAQEQLDVESWVDEVTHQGLQLLHDQRDTDLADGAARSLLFRQYWDWMEVVHWFADDPAAWNRNYALSFVYRLPRSMRSRAAAGFVDSGMLDLASARANFEGEARRGS
jgi:hypothetical protein